MNPFKSRMTSAEFNAALRNAGFGVEHGRIVDVSGKCSGFTTVPIFRGDGSVDRNATLSKVIRERDAQIERRAATVKRPV
jgi:hypothetical protein